MDDDRLVIVAQRADGGVDVVVPTAWILHRLQRNRIGYDKDAAVAQLRASGNSAQEVEQAANVLNLAHEERKVRGNPDNSAARIKGYLAFQALANAGRCTYGEAVAAVALKDCADHVSHKVMSAASVPNRSPTERRYRNALRADLRHDMRHAREIHRECIRHARAPRLAQLDVTYQRADEDGDAIKKRAIATQKQALRDATVHPDIDAAKTLEQLEAAWPKALTE